MDGLLYIGTHRDDTLPLTYPNTAGVAAEVPKTASQNESFYWHSTNVDLKASTPVGRWAGVDAKANPLRNQTTEHQHLLHHRESPCTH